MSRRAGIRDRQIASPSPVSDAGGDVQAPCKRDSRTARICIAAAARIRHVSTNDYVSQLDAAIAVPAPLDGTHGELIDALVERDARMREDLDETQVGELPAQHAQLVDELDVLLRLPVLGEQT